MAFVTPSEVPLPKRFAFDVVLLSEPLHRGPKTLMRHSLKFFVSNVLHFL